MTIQELKEVLIEKIRVSAEKAFGEKLDEVRLAIPPNITLGDFTIECFLLSKQFRKDPKKIAAELARSISENKGDIVQKAIATGAYVNIKISSDILFDSICSEIISQGDSFGNSTSGKKQRVVVEYLSPNTNKPLHLGHARNGSLGMAIANILEATGHTVIKANLVNDRGVHICKSMLAWKKWGEGETPESAGLKGDHFVGKWYVRYAQEEEKDVHLEEEVQDMLQKWEAGDLETIELWKTMNKWVYDGFSETYKNFGLVFDKFYYESDTYKLGKDIIAEGLEKKVFYKDQRGAIVYNLPEKEFGLNKDKSQKKVVVLRADGTSVYITQDLGTALLKVQENNLDSSIYVVGSEQGHHFRCLFHILKSLGYPWAHKLYHLSYGMVYLPEGKMKSREGKVVDADNLIEEVENLVAEGIKSRNNEKELADEEIKNRARKIGIGAIKFYLLRVNPAQDIYFDPKESISLEGFTGPYCQYAYARISSILKNAELISELKNVDFSVLDSDEERLIAQKLVQFPDEISSSVKEFNPSRIASHIFEISKTFNQFYHKHPVLNAENENLKNARLVFIQAIGLTIKKGLNLLGIDVLEKM